jgi:hypothetical protein
MQLARYTTVCLHTVHRTGRKVSKPVCAHFPHRVAKVILRDYDLTIGGKGREELEGGDDLLVVDIPAGTSYFYLGIK